MLSSTFLLQLVEIHGMEIFRSETRKYKKMLFPHPSHCPDRENKDEDDPCAGAEQPDRRVRDGVLSLTLHVLNEIGQKELANRLEKREYQTCTEFQFCSSLFLCVI